MRIRAVAPGEEFGHVRSMCYIKDQFRASALHEEKISMVISSHDADKFRLKHAEELLALFEEAYGRPARTTDELARWLDSVDDDLADDVAREVAEEAGRKAGREAAKKNGREAYEEASDRAYVAGLRTGA
jgi:hypothetical protein